jgi:hypothetical protein
MMQRALFLVKAVHMKPGAKSRARLKQRHNMHFTHFIPRPYLYCVSQPWISNLRPFEKPSLMDPLKGQ